MVVVVAVHIANVAGVPGTHASPAVRVAGQTLIAGAAPQAKGAPVVVVAGVVHRAGVGAATETEPNVPELPCTHVSPAVRVAGQTLIAGAVPQSKVRAGMVTVLVHIATVAGVPGVMHFSPFMRGEGHAGAVPQLNGAPVVVVVVVHIALVACVPAVAAITTGWATVAGQMAENSELARAWAGRQAKAGPPKS